MTSLLTDREKETIEHDVGDLVRGDGTLCQVVRPVVTGQGSFHGPHKESETVVCTDLPIEFLYGRPEDLVQEGADAAANVDFDADVLEGDFVVFSEIRFRVTDIEPHTVFGARSHKTLTLEREYRDEG